MRRVLLREVWCLIGTRLQFMTLQGSLALIMVVILIEEDLFQLYPYSLCGCYLLESIPFVYCSFFITKAEYIATTIGVKEATWLQVLVTSLMFLKVLLLCFQIAKMLFILQRMMSTTLRRSILVSCTATSYTIV